MANRELTVRILLIARLLTLRDLAQAVSKLGQRLTCAIEGAQRDQNIV
jgi:hypothetical protein